MRSYVIPFWAGITIGVAIAFIVATFPDSYLMNTNDYGQWKIPLWDDAVHSSTQSKDLIALTNQALVLRFAGFMLKEGYWFVATPTIITCLYARLRTEARRSRTWNRIFESFEWTFMSSVAFAVYVCLTAISGSLDNCLELVLGRTTLFLAVLAATWFTLLGPAVLGLAVFLILTYRDNRPQVPEYRYSPPGSTT
jgi:hypothetical protein